MEYNLELKENKKTGSYLSFLEISKFLKGDLVKVVLSVIAVLINSVLSIYAPLLIGLIIDQYIVNNDAENLVNGVLRLVVVYFFVAVTSYIQIMLMGRVGQNILYKLRSSIFQKIQSLPLAFFNQNRTGDLVSRINTDTEQLNQLFSEVLVQFLGNIFITVGIGIYMLTLNAKLGLIVLSISLILFIITHVVSPVIQRQNKKGLEKIGDLSADVQENLNNFRVIVAFNRRHYLREDFKKVNEETFKISTRTSFLNALLHPIYDYASAFALMFVLVSGIAMMLNGEITLGLFITFIAYTNDFYQPLKYMANLFASIQASLAAWSRVTEILGLKTNLNVLKIDTVKDDNSIIEFDDVSFSYGEKNVLKDVTLKIDEGKTYALVGPTGGGKSTTASLMARLYDPNSGAIYYKGKDIRTYEPEQLASEIGFILQEPILFTASIADNIKYGSPELKDLTTEELHKKLEDLNLDKIIDRFGHGLDTQISQNGNGISLGQRQLVAFLRVLLRNPKLLILDEATANIDTVTESLLQEILDAMPKSTTKVIIAHRLNTIKKADEIFFIADGELQRTASFDDIMEMLDKAKKSS